MTLLALPITSLACGSATDASTAHESDAISIGGGGGTTPPPTGFGSATTMPTNVGAHAATAAGITVSWNEPGAAGGNVTTILQRQIYDLAGNAVGTWQDVQQWSNTASGARTFFDAASISRNLPGSVHPLPPLVRFEPDHQVGYRLVEMPNGVTSCVGTTLGTCAYTQMFMGYMPKAKNYTVSQAHLRLHVSAATPGSNDANIHARAQLGGDLTYIDSTGADFRPGSDNVYDLKVGGLDGLGSLTAISVGTYEGDTEGFCVDRVALELDDTPAFDQTFSSCVWVGGTSHGVLNVPFTAIRSNPTWQGFAPPQFPNTDATKPITWVGYHADGMGLHLDQVMGTILRTPGAKSGKVARLARETTLTRKSPTVLHVQQHINDIDSGFGLLEANPNYDLVIHFQDGTCTGGHDWCVTTENRNAGSSYTDGPLEVVVDLTTWLADIVEQVVNSEIETKLDKLVNENTFPIAGGYCFPAPNSQQTVDDTAAFTGTTTGISVDWNLGSLTWCRKNPFL